MEIAIISSKYQTVIRRWIRKAMQLVYRNRVELIPGKNVREMRGFLKGINTDFQRDGDRV